MKKSYWFICLFVFLLPCTAHTETNSQASIYMNLKQMVNEYYFLNQNKIRDMSDLAFSIPETDRINLYEHNRKCWGWAFLPIYGNFIVGDYLGGGITITGIMVGTILMLAAYGYHPYVDLCKISSLILSYGSLLYSGISTACYVDYYNKQLRSGLGITDSGYPNSNAGLIVNLTDKTLQSYIYLEIICLAF